MGLVSPYFEEMSVRKLGTLALALLLGTAAPAFAAPLDLTILHTNDTHDHLTPFDTRQGKNLGGIARRAGLIAQIRKSAKRVLVVDAGDTFQGTPLFNFFFGEPDYLTMDQAGYDAVTIGNHDLDNGLANLQRQYRNRKFEMITSNLLDPKTHRSLFQPYKIFERDGLKVAVFGLMGDEALTTISKKNQEGFAFIPPYQMAQAMADELRKKADVVILLSHFGFEEDLAFASKIKGIDVIVGGHSHTKVERPKPVVNGDWKTLVVQNYQWGEFLGRLNLQVENGRVVGYDGELLPITAATPEDPMVAKTVESYQSQIEKRMAEQIGQSPKGLSSENKYLRDCELGNWTADLIRERGKAEVGIINAGGLRAPLQPGPVTVGSIFTIFPFENALVTVDLKGEVIQQILDRAAGNGTPGALQYSGLSYLAKDKRALEVRIGGRALEPQRTYRVATIDYIAQGNDRNELFTKATNYQPLGLLLREAVLEHVRSNPQVVPPAGGRIRVE